MLGNYYIEHNVEHPVDGSNQIALHVWDDNGNEASLYMTNEEALRLMNHLGLSAILGRGEAQ